MASVRPDRVGAEIQAAIADLLIRGDIHDPRIGFITVTKVVVSGDLSHANVYVMAQGEEPERLKAIEGLRSAAGFLRGRIAKALATRTIPELHFSLDRGLEHAARINAVLADLKRESVD